MTPRPTPTGPDISTPELCWEEATRQGRLADEANRAGDIRKVRQHIERARQLTLLALKLQSDEAKETA